MMNLLRGTMACGLILALAGVAWSGELIVDQKHPEASDKNPGTEAKPFKTIQAAVDKVQPGDTIWVNRCPGNMAAVIAARLGNQVAP